MRTHRIAIVLCLLSAPALAGPPSLLWNQLYAPTTGGDNRFGGAVYDAGGYVSVLYSFGNNFQELHVIRYDTAGNMAGDLKLDDNGYDIAWGMSFFLDGGGNYVVAGRGNDQSSHGEALGAAKYDWMGHLLWSTIYVQSVQSEMESAGGVIDGAGNVYVLNGNNNIPAPRHPFVVKIKADGTVQWGRTMPGWSMASSDDAYGTCIAANPGGGFFLGIRDDGVSFSSLVSYDVDGNRTWSVSSEGTPNALAVGLNSVYAAFQYGSQVGLWRLSAATGVALSPVALTPSCTSMQVSCVAVDAGGTVYVGGSAEKVPGHNSGLLVAFDAAVTTTLWAQLHDVGQNELGWQGNGGIVFDSLRNPYFVDMIALSTTYCGGCDQSPADLLSRKLSPATGGVTWFRQYDSSPKPEASDATADASGNVYMTTSRPPALVKYASGGGIEWTRPYTNPAYCVDGFGRVLEYGGQLMVSARVRLTNTWCGGGDDSGVINVARYNASGNQQYPDFTWIPSWGDVDPGPMALDAGANLYVGASSRTYTGGSKVTYQTVVKFDAGGAFAWSRTVAMFPSDMDGVSGIGVDAGANVYACGPGLGASGNIVTRVSKLQSDGTLLWSLTVAGGGASFSYPTSLAVDRTAGRIYVAAAESDSFTSPTFWRGLVLGLDTNGAPVWSRTNDGGQLALYWDVAVDASGTVFVTGTISTTVMVGGQEKGIGGGGTADIMLQAFDPADACYAPAWSARWDSGQGDDNGVAIATGGSVVVLGTTPQGARIFKYQEGQGDPAALAVGITVSPAIPVDVGTQLAIYLTVTNTGARDVLGTSTAFMISSGAGGFAPLRGPWTSGPAILSGGASRTWLWTTTATGAWTAQLTATATGTDACSGGAVKGETTGTLQAAYKSIPSAAVAVTRTICGIGDWVQVDLTVSNAGIISAMLNSVTATIYAAPWSSVEWAGGETQGSYSIGAGSNHVFSWTFSVSGMSMSSVGFVCNASGTDAVFGPMTSSATSSATLVNQARLSATVPTGGVTSVGGVITYQAFVKNLGGYAATGVSATLTLSTGGGMLTVSPPVPALATIQPGGSTLFTWTMTATGAGAGTFTVTVTGTDASQLGYPLRTQAVGGGLIQTAAALSATMIVGYPNPANTGQSFLVTLTVTNTGEATAAGVVATMRDTGGVSLVSGAAMPQDVPGGGSVTFVWTYQGTAAGTPVFSTTVTGLDGNTAKAVSTGLMVAAREVVQSPATLVATLVGDKAFVCLGESTVVTLSVQNTGQTAAASVTASAFLSSGAGALGPLSGPYPAFPQPVAGGTTLSFTWTYSGSTAGSVNLTTTVYGLDVNTGAGITSGKATTPAIAVQTPGALAAAASAPVTVSTGQEIAVRLTVTNTGGANVTGVSATTYVNPGSAAVTAVSWPLNSLTLAGGSGTTFEWRYTAVASGTVTFTMTAAGLTCGVTPAVISGRVNTAVQTAAALAARFAIQYPLKHDQSFTVALTVTNTGQAAANSFTAPPATPLLIGAATKLSGPIPASLPSLAGGTGTTFIWTFMADTPSVTLRFAATMTGTDANTALVTKAMPAATAYVNPAAILGAWMDVNPALIAGGQPSLVTLTVTNGGSAAAVSLTATVWMTVAGSVDAPGEPAPSNAVLYGITLNAGARVVVTWTLTGRSTGTMVLTATVSGVNALDSAPLAASASGTLSVASSLASQISVSPATVKPGDTFSLVLKVDNVDTPVAQNVGASLLISDPAVVEKVSGPVPAGTVNINSAASQLFTWTLRSLTAGTVTLTASASGTVLGLPDGTKSSIVLVIEAPGGVVPWFEGDAIVYPNPVSGDSVSVAVRLESNASSIEMDVYNTGYQRVWHGEFPGALAGAWPLEVTGVSRWAPGVYLIRIRAKKADGSTKVFPTLRMGVKR